VSFGYAAAVHVASATTIAMFWLRSRIDVTGRALGGLKDAGQLELLRAAMSLLAARVVGASVNDRLFEEKRRWTRCVREVIQQL
jgi:hypothetical protein